MLVSSVAGVLCCCCPLLLLLALVLLLLELVLALLLVLDVWMSESMKQEARESPPPLVEVNQAIISLVVFSVDDDDDSMAIKPDQDHNETIKNDILRAKMMSLELEIRKKDINIHERDNELSIARIEIKEWTDKCLVLKKEKEDKEEALDIAMGQTNSLEDEKLALKIKLKSYSNAIKKLRDVKTEEKNGDETVKDLRKVIKEKNKQIVDSDARARQLAQKLAELEAEKVDTNDDIGDKYKKVNDKLTTKTKDLKKAENNLKHSEVRAKELLDNNLLKNKKISELENENVRLKLMKEQSEDIENRIKSVRKDEDKNKKVEKKVEFKEMQSKCRYENTGLCRNKTNCNDIHPKITCQSHSKLGSCPLVSSCEHRHPFGICYDWEKYGTCNNGDNCRHRHPFDLIRQVQSDPFLGYGSPTRQDGLGGQGQFNQRSPGHPQGNHDLRGSRW